MSCHRESLSAFLSPFLLPGWLECLQLNLNRWPHHGKERNDCHVTMAPKCTMKFEILHTSALHSFIIIHHIHSFIIIHHIIMFWQSFSHSKMSGFWEKSVVQTWANSKLDLNRDHKQNRAFCDRILWTNLAMLKMNIFLKGMSVLYMLVMISGLCWMFVTNKLYWLLVIF